MMDNFELWCDAPYAMGLGAYHCFCSLVSQKMGVNTPYVYMYHGSMMQTRVRDIRYYKHDIDTMVSFVWRPYRDSAQ